MIYVVLIILSIIPLLMFIEMGDQQENNNQDNKG